MCFTYAFLLSASKGGDIDQNEALAIKIRSDPNWFKDLAYKQMMQGAADKLKRNMDDVAQAKNEAVEAVQKYQQQMEALKLRETSKRAAELAAAYDPRPKWEKMYDEGSDLVKAGHSVQVIVDQTIPFDVERPPWQ